MIHVITISALPELLIEQVCKHLFLNYGVGTEHSRHNGGAEKEVERDAMSLLSREWGISSFADDKTLLLTDEPITLLDGPMGIPPSGGFADPSRSIAVVTTHGIPFPKRREQEEDPNEWLSYTNQVARRAVHQVGLLWGLHRCVNTRCAMLAPWLKSTSPNLCDFCRERSETRISRARS